MATTALFALLASALFLSYPSRVSDPTFLSPHENVRFHLAQRWIEEGRPTQPLPAFSRLPRDIAPALTPRDAAEADGKVVPKDFPYALGTVTLLVALAPVAATYLTFASGLGVIALVALLAYELSRRRSAALLAAGFVAVSAPFWSASAGLLETGGTTTTFFLAGLVALCRSRRPALTGGRATAWMVAGGALLGTAVGFHHAAAILVGSLVVGFSLPRLGGSIRNGLWIAAGAAAAVLPLLAFNTWLFGSPLTTGYEVGSSFYNATIEDNSAGLTALQPHVLIEQLWRYGARPEVIGLLAAAAFGWFLLQRSRPGNAARALGASLVLGGVPYLLFTGARPLWGSDTYRGNASFLRYALPLFVVAATFAAAWVCAPSRRWRWARVALAVVVLLGAVLTTTTSPGNPIDRRRSVQGVSHQRQRLLELIPQDALVVTARGDKLLWPRRDTLVVPFLVRKQVGSGHLNDIVPRPERLSSVLVRLHTRGEDVWLFDDSAWLTSDRHTLRALDLLLQAHGLQRQRYGSHDLYRVIAAA